MPHQVPIPIHAPLLPGRAAEVTALLDTLRKDVAHDGGPFSSLPGVHFARLFRMPGDAEIGVPDSLVYLGEVDAPVLRHLDALAGEETLAALFAQCVDFPEHGGRGARLSWLRRNRIGQAAWYVHRVGRGVDQVRDEARLRNAVGEFLDGRDWSGQAPTAVPGPSARSSPPARTSRGGWGPLNRPGGTFVEQARPVRRRHRDLPEFVRVRGGAYFFLPGVAALRYLARMSPEEA